MEFIPAAATTADRDATAAWVVTFTKISFSCCKSCWGAEGRNDDGVVVVPGVVADLTPVVSNTSLASLSVTRGNSAEDFCKIDEDGGGGCWNTVDVDDGAGRTPTNTMPSSSSSSSFSFLSPAVLLPGHILLLLL